MPFRCNVINENLHFTLATFGYEFNQKLIYLNVDSTENPYQYSDTPILELDSFCREPTLPVQ